MKLIKGKLARMLFCALTIFLAACMIFTGCGQKTTPPDNGEETNGSEDLESGLYYSGNSRPQSIYRGGYKSDKTEFDIDNVTLEFFFGGYYSSGVEFALEHGPNYPGFNLYFANDEEDRVHIKRVEENFVSEEYRCKIVHSEDHKSVLKVEYNHFEMLTIPKELFTKEKGRVSLQIRSVHAKDPFQEERCLLRIQVFYKVIGDTVVLSNERFE